MGCTWFGAFSKGVMTEKALRRSVRIPEVQSNLHVWTKQSSKDTEMNVIPIYTIVTGQKGWLGVRYSLSLPIPELTDIK